MYLSFRDIDYFLTTLDHGHLGRAAAELGITQSALSKALQRLEKQTGLVLFYRGSKQLQLSAHGLIFTEYARQLEVHYQNMMRETEALYIGQAGLLRIGATAVTMDNLVMPALSRLLPHRPAMQVSLSVGLSDTLFTDVIEGRLDVAVAPTYFDDLPYLETKTLQVDKLVLVVAKDHPLAQKNNVSLKDTLAYRWILPAQGASARQRLLKDFKEQGMTMPIAALEAPSISTGMLNMVANSHLISFAPQSLLHEDPGLGLTQLNLDVPTRRRLCLITRQEARWSPLMQAFSEAISQLTAAHACNKKPVV